MKIYSFLFISILYLLNSCAKKTTEVTEPGAQISSLEVIARNNFKSDYKILYNSNKTFAAVYENLTTNEKDYPTLKIMLFDTKNNSIVWGRKAYRGSISWESKSKLKVDTYDNNKRTTVIYDTKTKEVTYIQ